MCRHLFLSKLQSTACYFTKNEFCNCSTSTILLNSSSQLSCTAFLVTASNITQNRFLNLSQCFYYCKNRCCNQTVMKLPSAKIHRCKESWIKWIERKIYLYCNKTENYSWKWLKISECGQFFKKQLTIKNVERLKRKITRIPRTTTAFVLCSKR